VHEAVLAGGDPHDQGRPRPLRADLLLHVQGAPSPAAPSAAASLPDAQLSDSPGRLARDLCRAGLHELAGSGGVLQVFGTLGGDMVHWRPGAAALRRVAPLLGAATTAAPVGLAHRLRGFAGLLRTGARAAGPVLHRRRMQARRARVLHHHGPRGRRHQRVRPPRGHRRGGGRAHRARRVRGGGRGRVRPYVTLTAARAAAIRSLGRAARARRRGRRWARAAQGSTLGLTVAEAAPRPVGRL